jgi:acyl-CoA synthetase (AMP-forming)/AMP-acid ligase II
VSGFSGVTSAPTYNLADLFELVVDAVPDRLALVAGDVRLTYRQLDDRANRLAHALAERGIGAGDHVAVYAWNRAEWVEAWWASYKLRAVPININYRYVGEELRYVLGNADAKAVLHEAEFAGLLDEVASELPQLRVRLELGEQYETALAAASSTATRCRVTLRSLTSCRVVPPAKPTIGRPKRSPGRRADPLRGRG